MTTLTAQPLRVAIIGAGIGREHLEAYRELAGKYEVRIICDLDEERARSIADSDSLTITSDLSSVLQDADIDIVDVCLPPHLHFDTTIAALQAGKHVVCEKPLVTSLAQADALAEAAQAAGRTITPVFQYRYGPAMQQLQALMAAGLTGKPYMASLETHWNRDADYYAIAWRGTWAGERGGAVLGHAIHNHDLLTHVLGPIASLSANCATRVNDIETEDCAAIIFEMENGALATSSITLGAATDTSRLRFVFEGLTATSGTAPYAPATDSWEFTARDPQKQSAVDAVLASVTGKATGFTGFFDALSDALNGQPGQEVLLADGRRSLELVSAIYLSAKTGNKVALPLGPDDSVYESWLP
ncbi:Gfo/Idh/MocA family protein [Granulosicoccus antarcticus]|uniref:4-carboxy-2-hydroxymuconate-6-semialdehyde dehydrogenase n=1 Tax=Granulosicoccus antarcticus IMCC3135 TaxID=1192854 RepID=A0A2Z2NRQ6_9GAMM|nr:Gfo/Idh/MocA family oxidoreductase [Granulosicoccus antarcticus]ASJ72691.1 4-carboxy-2-hydroxymuconate-6-semialdehyde dehydrogenase [Granulosicoccus antarcticus IMCC3135]